MKKFAIITSLIGIIGIICANCINSAWTFNQPKAPSILVK